ncbi:MAG: hypothetical protein GY830_06125 [Bacteroidetes bacterium]|nr:hypothetical protein [Bacteroidota bacterium]
MKYLKKPLISFLLLISFNCSSNKKNYMQQANLTTNDENENKNNLLNPISPPLLNTCQSNATIVINNDNDNDSDSDNNDIILSGYNKHYSGNENISQSLSVDIDNMANSLKDINVSSTYNLDIINDTTPIHLKKNTSMNTLTGNNNENLNRTSSIYNHVSNPDNLLFDAIRDNENLDIIKFICKKFPNSYKKQDFDKNFPIDYAIRNSDIYNYLKSLKAPSKIDNQLLTAFNKCNYNKISEMIQIDRKYLLMKDLNDNTLLHIACRKQNYKLANIVIQEFPNLVLALNKNNETPLEVLIKNGDNKLAKLLIQTQKSNIYNRNIKEKMKRNKKTKQRKKSFSSLDSYSRSSLSNNEKDNNSGSEYSKRLTNENLELHDNNINNKNLKLTDNPSTKSYYKDQLHRSSKQFKTKMKKMKNTCNNLSQRLTEYADDNEELQAKIENTIKSEPELKMEEEAIKLQMQALALENTKKNFERELNKQTSMEINSIYNNNLIPDWDKEIKKLHTYEAHKGIVWDTVFIDNSQLLISAGEDKTIKIWNIDTTQLLGNISSGVLCLGYSKSYKNIFTTGGIEKNIIFWDIMKKEKVSEIKKTHSNYVNKIKFNYDGKILASASTDSKIELWDPTNLNKKINTIKTKKINTIAFHPKENTIAASYVNDNTINIWDLRNCSKPVKNIKGNKTEIYGLSYSPNGTYLASRNLNFVKVFNLLNDKWLYKINVTPNQENQRNSMKNIISFNRQNSKSKINYFIPDKISFSYNNKFLVTIDIDNKGLHFWKADTGEYVRKKNAHHDIFNIKFGSSTNILSTSGKESKIRLFVPSLKK